VVWYVAGATGVIAFWPTPGTITTTEMGQPFESVALAWNTIVVEGVPVIGDAAMGVSDSW
jgi:hypothetical protein